MTGIALIPLEQAVMRMLLDGDDPVLRALSEQFSLASVKSRRLTGAGFYLDFQIPDSSHRLGNRNMTFDDVMAEIEGLQHGAGFVLFVRDGVIETLEGYSYDELWPTNVQHFELSYIRWETVERPHHASGGKPSPICDLASLKLQIG
jgi:hypothetical protein